MEWIFPSYDSRAEGLTMASRASGRLRPPEEIVPWSAKQMQHGGLSRKKKEPRRERERERRDSIVPIGSK